MESWLNVIFARIERYIVSQSNWIPSKICHFSPCDIILQCSGKHTYRETLWRWRLFSFEMFFSFNIKHSFRKKHCNNTLCVYMCCCTLKTHSCFNQPFRISFGSRLDEYSQYKVRLLFKNLFFVHSITLDKTHRGCFESDWIKFYETCLIRR